MAKLFLIPTSLNPQIDSCAILPAQQQLLKDLNYFIVETAKIGRQHIKQLQLTTPLQQLNILELNKHKQDYSALIAPLQQGNDVGLISDCGCPAVADPGGRVVAIAHELGHEVIPLVGPSSILLTLMASGLNGQNFSFIGYLPAEPTTRKSQLKNLEQNILRNKSTYIFIETPFRNQHLFNALTTSINPEIKLCLGINLMSAYQQIITKTIQEWKKKPIVLDKKEVIFLVGI